MLGEKEKDKKKENIHSRDRKEPCCFLEFSDNFQPFGTTVIFNHSDTTIRTLSEWLNIIVVLLSHTPADSLKGFWI